MLVTTLRLVASEIMSTTMALNRHSALCSEARQLNATVQHQNKLPQQWNWHVHVQPDHPLLSMLAAATLSIFISGSATWISPWCPILSQLMS